MRVLYACAMLGSFPRSALSFSAGANTQLFTIVQSLGVLVLVFAIFPVFAFLPLVSASYPGYTLRVCVLCASAMCHLPVFAFLPLVSAFLPRVRFARCSSTLHCAVLCTIQYRAHVLYRFLYCTIYVQCSIFGCELRPVTCDL